MLSCRNRVLVAGSRHRCQSLKSRLIHAHHHLSDGDGRSLLTVNTTPLTAMSRLKLYVAVTKSVPLTLSILTVKGLGRHGQCRPHARILRATKFLFGGRLHLSEHRL